MKKIVLFTIITFLTFQLNAQISNVQQAGIHLQKSANFTYAGMALTAVSAVPLLLPPFGENTAAKEIENLRNSYTTNQSEALSNPNKKLITQEEFNRRLQQYENQKDDSRQINYYLSGAIGLAAIVCYINGIQHIKVSGKQLELQTSNNTVGIAIKF